MIDLALDKSIYIEDDIKEAIQELDILFSTSNTELLGDVHYGTNFESFLWQINPSPNQLEKYIQEKINTCTLYMRMMDYSINVSAETDGYESMYLVRIEIRYNNKVERKNYKLISSK